MSRSPPTKKSSVCRRLVFDDDESDTPPEVNNTNAGSNHDNHQQIQVEILPAHLEEAHSDNIHNAFVEELQRSREQAREKWNFDFETETPLEGNWEWEKVEDVNNMLERDRDIGRVNVQNNGDFRDEHNKSL